MPVNICLVTSHGIATVGCGTLIAGGQAQRAFNVSMATIALIAVAIHDHRIAIGTHHNHAALKIADLTALAGGQSISERKAHVITNRTIGADHFVVGQRLRLPFALDGFRQYMGTIIGMIKNHAMLKILKTALPTGRGLLLTHRLA